MLDKTPARPPRISAKLERALEELANRGQTQRGAARAAGMDETSLCKALRKPHVKERLETLKAQAVLDVERELALTQAAALQEGRRLMLEAESETVRRAMVELFAPKPDAKTTQAPVNVSFTANLASGYAYAPPGSKVLDITPSEEMRATDMASGHHDKQAVEKPKTSRG